MDSEPSSSSSGFKLFGKTIVASEKVDGQDHQDHESSIIIADHEETSTSKSEESSENIAITKTAAASTKRGQLPCPRCKSKETKFCYFNNYNVNQPRHFCKACHRYWTAGGALRNVPVGAGRRKNRALPQGSGSGGDDDGGGGGMCLAAGGEEVERWLMS